ncbi:MAG: hypothetical protein OXH07_00195 [Chloroflexi bacterium]|nr:hypothetical protein [Chloroflexota bacterium]
MKGYGRLRMVGLAVVFSVAAIGYGCTGDDSPTGDPNPEPYPATVTPTPRPTSMPTAAASGTPTLVATATAVPTPIVDIRLVGSEEFRARVREALQLLAERVPVALQRVEKGLDRLDETAGVEQTSFDPKTRIASLDKDTLFLPGYPARQQVVWLASELVRFACYNRYWLNGEDPESEQAYVGCLREQAGVLPLLTDDDYYGEYFRSFVQGKIDAYDSPTGEAHTQSREAAGTPVPELRLSDELREFIDEVADARQLSPPSAVRIRTGNSSILADVYLGAETARETWELDQETRVFRVLGYLKEDEHLRNIQRATAGNLLGFYVFRTETIWLATEYWKTEIEDLNPEERETLVHEIIHALQDHHFDLAATYTELGDLDASRLDLDARLAFDAVVEGDATAHTARFVGQVRSIPTGGGRYSLATAGEGADVPASIWRESNFPYNAGADWARFVLANHGVETLNRYFVEPPPATAFILHPELASTDWKPERVSSVDFLPFRRSLIPLGLRPSTYGTLGEFYLLNYLLRDVPFSPDWLHDPQNQAAVEAAAGWSGGFYYLYEDFPYEEEKIENWVLVARIRFVSEEDAREFADVHRAITTRGADVVEDGGVTLATQGNGNVTALLDPIGREVIFAIGANAEVARAVIEPLVKG